MKTFPPRVHIIFASDSPHAIIFRRGPSRYVLTMGWNRDTDEFTLGQWLRGRIYERRSDLSSDGKHLLYFALNGKWESESKGSWTALSSYPFLKAHALWAKGDGWNGGGLFINKDTIWLNGCHDELFNNSSVHISKEASPSPSFGGECPGVYYHRLRSSGWKMTPSTHEQSSHHHQYQFTKELSSRWLLTKIAHETIRPPEGKGCYFDTHILEDREKGIEIACDDWEWADYDGKRLSWTSQGQLYACPLDNISHETPTLLFDFRSQQYQRIKAPY